MCVAVLGSVTHDGEVHGCVVCGLWRCLRRELRTGVMDGLRALEFVCASATALEVVGENQIGKHIGRRLEFPAMPVFSKRQREM